MNSSNKVNICFRKLESDFTNEMADKLTPVELTHYGYSRECFAKMGFSCSIITSISPNNMHNCVSYVIILQLIDSME